jgi:tetratricopeptide (TPR) repeat protein
MNWKATFYLTLMTVLATATSAFAQNKKGEPPKQSRYEDYKLRSNFNPDNVYQILAQAKALKQTDRSAALVKVQEALGLSIAAGNLPAEAQCYLLIAEINESIDEWKLAFENYQAAYKKISGKIINDDQVTALLGMGEMSVKLGNLEEAKAYFDRLPDRTLTDDQRIRKMIGVSEIFYLQGNNTQALSALESDSRLKRKSPVQADPRLESQRAKVYASDKQFDNAQKAIISSQNTVRSAPQAAAATPDLAVAKEEVAGALHDQARYDDEIAVRNNAIELNLEQKNLPEVTRDKVGISKALAAKGETSEAIRELREAALMADTINDPKAQAKAFLTLADLYEKNGRDDQAIDAYKRYSKAVEQAETRAEQRLTEKADLIRKQKDIEELSKELSIGKQQESLEKATVARQQLIIYGLIAIIIIIAITSYFMYRSAHASKIANQLLALKSLRSQMNPHFIFNALNSVNHFVAQNDERAANKFLAEFSRLMRLVLENSQEDFISLTTEQEIISLYLKLEHYRFRDKFDYTIEIEESIDPETVAIPPMLIQPYIENAVWHGLRYKEEKGKLCLTIRKTANGILVEINDDGIGRKKSAMLKTENQKKHQSTGLKNIEERLAIINKVYKAGYRVEIADAKTDGSGTRVSILVPQHKITRS